MSNSQTPGSSGTAVGIRHSTGASSTAVPDFIRKNWVEFVKKNPAHRKSPVLVAIVVLRAVERGARTKSAIEACLKSSEASGGLSVREIRTTLQILLKENYIVQTEIDSGEAQFDLTDIGHNLVGS